MSYRFSISLLFGAAMRDRTPDIFITSEALYQLSYNGLILLEGYSYLKIHITFQALVGFEMLCFICAESFKRLHYLKKSPLIKLFGAQRWSRITTALTGGLQPLGFAYTQSEH